MATTKNRLIYLPKTYELVVGDTFELFYRGILLVMDPYHYNIRVRCARGSAYMRKYVFTPTEADIGEYPLTVDLLNDFGETLDSATVTIRVRPLAPSPDKETYVLTFGDSMCEGGHWQSECLRRLTATDGEPAGQGLHNIRFIGTREGKYGCRYEGYGGWRFHNYNMSSVGGRYFKYVITDHNKTDLDRHSLYTDGISTWKVENIEDGRIKMLRSYTANPSTQKSGVLKHVEGGIHHEDIVFTDLKDAANNPFFNVEEDRVDFKSYAQKLGAERIDICCILLGWNSTGSAEDEYKEQVRICIEHIRRDFPACKIVLMGLPMSSYDGLGMNYGTSWNYMEKNTFTKRLESWYMDICGEYDHVYYVNTSGQFDSEYGYPTIERPVNVRSAKTEVIQSNGVHPTYEGYLQIADAVYRQINALLCE